MAATQPDIPPEVEGELIDELGRFINDPLGFVEYAFEWGEGDLKGQTGPDTWQREFLENLGATVRERNFHPDTGSVMPVRMAVGSGHGIGKSALVSWLILWIMSTRPGCRGSVTASTVAQLQTKTIPELQKWTNRAINGHWFRVDTSKIVCRESEKDWRADFLTARKENSEAFAGQHNAQSTSFYVIDEGSGVPDEIYEVAEGGLTDGEPMIFVFGNRTRPVGYFNDLFTRKKNWTSRTVDSREAKMTNKEQIEEWRREWGEDSDFFRVRVMGLPPSASAEQLIPADAVARARTADLATRHTEPLVMGVDVARFGNDASVIVYRQGNDARSIPAKKMREWSTEEVADQVAADIKDFRPVAVFVDGGGVGGGVVDKLHRLGHSQVIEVNFGGKSMDPEFFNKRSEMWGLLARELKRGLCIEDDDDLESELLAQEYQIDGRTRKTRLIGKEDLRRLGLPSPDHGDALALTYAQPIGDLYDDGDDLQTEAIL